MTLQEIYEDSNIAKPILLKNTSDEFFILQCPLNADSTAWYLGIDAVLLPGGGYRGQANNAIYPGNVDIWSIVGIE